MEAELSVVNRTIQEIRDQRHALSNEQRSLSKRYKTLETCIPKIRVEIDAFDTTRANLIQCIPELRSQCQLSKADAKKLKELMFNVETCEKEMSSCLHLASALDDEVNKLQKAILDAGGPRLTKQQKRCEKLLHEIDEAEGSLNTAKVTLSSSQKVLAKAAQVFEDCDKSLKKCISELEKKVEELRSLDDDAVHVMEAYEKVKVVEAEKRSQLDELVNEADSIRQSQAELKCKEIELIGKIDEIRKQQTESVRKKDHWLDQIRKLQTDVNEEEDDMLSDDEEDEEREQNKDDDEMLECRSDTGPTSTTASLPMLSDSVLDKYDKATIKADIVMLESERANIAKNANMGAIAEYRKKESDYLTRYVVTLSFL
jgi:structural maintenance of chromosome 4